ncbi:MAG: glycosyltransferase family 2 protein [Patescibacteria group bacterium]
MENCPKVFIVILNYNGKEVIKSCLLSVFKNDYPSFEIVLVDNNSTDGSFEAAKAGFSKVHFIKNEENLGFSAGNNIGIRFALERMADYVLLLNNDTQVEKDFLTRLVKIGEKNEKIGLLSPLIFNGDTRQVWFSGGVVSWLRMKTFHQKTVKTLDHYESSFLTGCALLVKKQVFKAIGLLDEDYFLYWEDADFSWRSRQAGFKNVVVTSSWIYHFERSEKNKKNKIYWLVISGLIFFKKNTPFWLKPWIKLFLILRKTKNFIDNLFGRNELASSVKKAYQDFKDAKF